MAYATVADATERYGDDYVTVSSDRDNDGSLDTAAFELALDDASDWIDSYLSGRYALPLAIIPRRLVRVCVDVAIFESSETAGTMTTLKEMRFMRAKEYMEQVATGKLRLTLDGETATGVNNRGAATIVTQRDQKSERMYGSRRFTRDKLSKL